MNETARTRHDDATPLLSPPASFGGGNLPPGPNGQHAEAVAAWLRWHALELAGLGVPLALALAISGWLVLLAAPAAGLWAVHATRQAHRRTRLNSGERTALTSPNTTPDTTTTGSEENKQ